MSTLSRARSVYTTKDCELENKQKKKHEEEELKEDTYESTIADDDEQTI